MRFYIDVLDKVEQLSKLCNNIDESWGHLTIDGNYHDDVCKILAKIIELFEASSCGNAFAITFDGSIINKTELEEYNGARNSFSTWRININKQNLIAKKFNPDFNSNFFLRAAKCETWLNATNPLDESNPLNKLSPLKIIIRDVPIPFGGEHLYFLPAEEKFFSQIHKNSVVLPTIENIKENVHFITDFKIGFNPNTYIITEGDFSSPLSKCILKQSSIVLSCCILNEFYAFDRVVLDGLKLTTLTLSDATINYEYNFNQELVTLISWMYEDRVSTRKKLFNERLTLEIDESDCLIKSLQEHLTPALEQAKERFNFVILDRKDEYVKELKDLLKDLRTQSDLYSLKIRTLLSNFLRDILAGIILIGFTIFTKFTDNIGLDKHKLIDYVFTGLAIYYLISIILQAAIDWTDIGITNKELRYWKKASKELIPEKEFDKHLKDSLKSRRNSLWILYPILSILYLVLAFACYKYPGIFKQLINQ